VKKVKVILDDGRTYTKSISDISVIPWKVGIRLGDLKTIASSVFAIEDEIKKGNDIREVRVPLFGDYSPNVSDMIERLIEYLFSKIIKVTLTKNPQQRLKDISDDFLNGFTCLFSGGLDSYSGILNSNSNYGKVIGAFTRHADQRQLGHLIDRLQNSVLGNHGIVVETIDTIENKNYTRLTRGILYVLNSLLLRNTNIVISEVGPTMYQPRFTLLDDISFTTHPRIIEFSKKVAEEVLDTDVKIIKPNENLTKAEVAATCPEKTHIKLTCSCRTMRFCNSGKPNGDTCYGCIMRRLALLVAGVQDGAYRKDILTLTESVREQYSNILHLLRFSMDFLSDYEGLPTYMTDIIRKYGKREVFRRYSLDTFAGLLLLRKEGKLTDPIYVKFLESALKTISIDELEDRIESVRSGEFKPDFQNMI
jgi:hypothetical protein